MAGVRCGVASLGIGLALGACGETPRLPPDAPVVLVVVDTLRADGLGLYGYPRPTSPQLDVWAESAAVFERAFATSPWTLPSFGSLLTGRYPSGHGSGRGKRVLPSGRTKRTFLAVDESVPSLAPLLAERGYDTAAFVTNTFLRPTFGLTSGFATYDHARNRFIGERRADVMVDRAVAWLREREPGEPWLLLLHFLDPHLPYDPPPQVAGRLTSEYRGELELPVGAGSRLVRRVKRRQIELDEEDRAFIRGAYDEEVLWVDAQVGRFLTELEAGGVLERGLVVFTADHGEELFDHGAIEHGHTMYQELLHIPFLVWGHEVEAGRRSEPVSLVDIVPTVLDALGMEAPAGVDGTSLWPVLTGREGLADRRLLAQNTLYGPERQAVVEWPYKLIASPGSEAPPQLFDLEADPGERRDLGSEKPSLRQRLRAALPESSPIPDQPGVTLDAEERRELRALGYLR